MRQRRADAHGKMAPLLKALAFGCVGVAVAAQAQVQSDDDGPRRVLALEPRVSVQETLTDNVQPGSQSSSADSITRLTAGLGWLGRSGLVRGYADYALTGIVYARRSDLNELQNALNADVSADLIENRLQLLGSAAIARTAISAFGVQPSGAGGNSSNVTETRTLQLTPTLRGPLGPSVRYQASLAHRMTSSADASVGDSNSTTISLHLEPTERARLSWGFDASSLISDFKLGRRSRDDRIYGSLSADLPDWDVVLSGRLGAERTDIATIDMRNYTTWGMGLHWRPTPMTRIEVDVDDRFFGRSHEIVAEYRLPRTVFALRGGRTLSTSGNQLAAGRSTFYNAVFNDPRNVSLQPDPVLRDLLVRQFLVNNGIDPNAPVNTGALRSAATLQESLELTAVWTGVRQSVMIMIGRNSTRRIDALGSTVGDLSEVDRVDSSTVALKLGHRLTPSSTLSLHFSSQHNRSEAENRFSRQSQVDLRWQSQLTPDSSAAATLSRSHFYNGLGTSDETALTASYGVRF